MKHSRFYRAIVAITMILIGWLPSLAHDFEVDGIYYKKINSSKVEVTYRGSSNSSYENEYTGNVIIPSSVNYNGTTYSVTRIGGFTFRECSSLTGIEIPNSVTSIGEAAFYYCTSLTGIEIPNSVTSIGEAAFYYCTSLTDIEIPNSVTSIGKGAFYYCTSLTSIEIPNSVTSIGKEAFYFCTSLTKITCLATNPPTIYYDTFSDYKADLYVPASRKSAYKVAEHWKNFNILEISVSIDGVDSSDINLAIIEDNIVVKNAIVGSNVHVYTTNGTLIASEVATDRSVVIDAPIKGIYVVVVDSKSFKVMVK